MGKTCDLQRGCMAELDSALNGILGDDVRWSEGIVAATLAQVEQ